MLKADAKRLGDALELGDHGTGIYVRAMTEDGWQSVDVAWLDRESFLEWIKDRDVTFLHRLALMLLGHQP